MKQTLLILSIIIAAFIAACSESTTSLSLKTNGLHKTLAQQEKASSDEELKKLKAKLEKNKNVEIPDIITAVKMKFGHNYSAKEQLQFGSKDQKKFEDSKKDIPDEKLTKQPAFDGVAMIDSNSDASVISPVKIKNEESKYICIQTCEKQIIILRKMDDTGKVISVSAFVAAEISSTNVEILTKTNKTLKSIAASFDLASDRMALKFNMTKDKKDMILVTADFPYSQNVVKGLDFSDEKGDETGVLDITKVYGNKSILMTFVNDKDTIKIKLKDDLGVFGKNKLTITESGNDKNLQNSGQPSEF